MTMPCTAAATVRLQLGLIADDVAGIVKLY